MKMEILKALNGATQDDLAGIYQEIEAKKTAITGLECEILSLKQLRRLVDVRLNGKPERKKAERKKQYAQAAANGVETGEEKRLRIGAYLAQQQGKPVKPAIISNDLGLAYGSMTHYMNHDWFTKTADGYTLSFEGK